MRQAGASTVTPEEALERAVVHAQYAEDEVRKGSLRGAGMAALATAWASIASAGAMLLPPEIALEADKVDDATERLTAVEAVLDEARRNGPRHPAIHKALGIIRGVTDGATRQGPQ